MSICHCFADVAEIASDLTDAFKDAVFTFKTHRPQLHPWSKLFYSFGIMEHEMVSPALCVAQTTYDWEYFCAYEFKPFVKQWAVSAFSIPPFDTWSNSCVNFEKMRKKMFWKTRFAKHCWCGLHLQKPKHVSLQQRQTFARHADQKGEE